MGQMTLERARRGRLPVWGIRFFLTGALAAVQTPAGFAPFALGCVSAAGPGSCGGAALAGAAAGAALFLNFTQALPFLAVAILILTASTALQGWALARPRASALTAAGLFLAVNGIYVIQSLSPWADLGPCLGAAGLTGAAAWLFRPLFRRGEGRNPADGLLALLAALLLGLADFQVLGFSPGRGLLCLLAVWAAYDRGPAAGTAAALLLGLAADLCGLQGGSFTAAWGLAGLAAGSFAGRRALAALAALAAVTAGVLAGNVPGLLPETAAAMAVFLALPRRLMGGRRTSREPLDRQGRSGVREGADYQETGTRRREQGSVLRGLERTGACGTAEDQETGTRRREQRNPLRWPGRGERTGSRRTAEETEGAVRWRKQLDRAAAALRDLYDSLGRGVPASGDENPAIIFDRAAERVCRSCSLCELCWQREYTGTFNALNDATPYLLERGRVLARDFPVYFTGRCIHLTEFMTAVNGELSAFLLRRQYRRQLEETRRSARGQYAQLSELLTATAAGLTAPASGPAEGGICRVGAVLRPREGETVCGDTVTSFRTDGGLWCLLLADGMGSGEPARKESAMICRLLQQFLEAGVAPAAALKTLNSAMALRGTETGTFTTIDLCVYDPGAGEAVFYKFGAAPSYLKKGGVVRRITGGSLPAGLQGGAAVPDVTRASLDPGGFAVMISDGVADPEGDEWLMNLLAGWSGEDPQVLAGLILQESVRREKLRDDCGVQVLYRPPESVREV